MKGYTNNNSNKLLSNTSMSNESYIFTVARMNDRANTRDSLIGHASNISISDLDSIRHQASMLAVLTAQRDEMTRNSADVATNQCVRLMQALDSLLAKSSVDEMKQALVGVVTLVGNINAGLSSSLNGRSSSLNADVADATRLPDYYDTDPENFWTNPNNFDSSPPNTQRQKFEVADKALKTARILDLAANMLSQHFHTNESYDIETPAISMSVAKLASDNLPSSVNIRSGTFRLPAFCELNPRCGSSTPVIVKSQMERMASSGHNGPNETYTGYSASIDLSFYDANGAVISVKNTRSPIDMWIPRDPTMGNVSFQYVNVSNLTVSSKLQFLANAFTIKSDNASIHIQIKPVASYIGYVVLLKLGYTPIVNTTHADYDFMKVLCPQSSKKSSHL